MRKTNLLVLGLVVSIAAGCYNTNGLKNGGLVCGDNGSCPAGFTCVVQANGSAGHCWRNGTGPDAGTNQDTGSPQSDAGTSCVTVAPYGPFTTCSASQPIADSTCDPVCQSGCACNHRCILNPVTSASFTCEATSPPAGTTFVDPMGSCEANVNSCTPGSVCIGDPVCKHICYRTCRVDGDCSARSKCTVSVIYDVSGQPVKNVSLCSPPTESCNPVGEAKCAADRAGFKCVFLAGLTGVGNNDATVCDCSSQHGKAVGQSCTTAPDNCQAGSVCVSGTCHTVCSQRASGSACANGGGCTPIYGSTNYGYCR